MAKASKKSPEEKLRVGVRQPRCASVVIGPTRPPYHPRRPIGHLVSWGVDASSA